MFTPAGECGPVQSSPEPDIGEAPERDHEATGQHDPCLWIDDGLRALAALLTRALTVMLVAPRDAHARKGEHPAVGAL